MENNSITINQLKFNKAKNAINESLTSLRKIKNILNNKSDFDSDSINKLINRINNSISYLENSRKRIENIADSLKFQ